MSKYSSSKAGNAHSGKKPRGCLRAVGLYFLWFCFSCVIFAELIPEEKQNGTVFFLSLFLILLLPFYIKPLCRLIATGLKKISERRKAKRLLLSIDKPYSSAQGIQQNVPIAAPSKIEDSFLPIASYPITGRQLEPQAETKKTSVLTAIMDAPEPASEQEKFHGTSAATTIYTDVLPDKHEKVQAELLSIDLMEGHQFESWCADALKSIGFCNVSVTPGSGDQGVDILADKDGVKYAFQCKRYTSDLGNTPIQEVHSGKDYYHRHVGVVITNRLFTSGATALAAETGTLLWDREWITNYLYQKHSDTPCRTITMPNAEKPKDDGDDELFDAAVDIVLETGLASVSMLQRRLRLGYARAARLVDMMEERGIVGPFRGSRQRAILITQEQWRSAQK